MSPELGIEEGQIWDILAYPMSDKAEMIYKWVKIKLYKHINNYDDFVYKIYNFEATSSLQ